MLQNIFKKIIQIFIILLSLSFSTTVLYAEAKENAAYEMLRLQCSSTEYGGIYQFGEEVHMIPVFKSKDKMEKMIHDWNKQNSNSNQIFLDEAVYYSYQELEKGREQLLERLNDINGAYAVEINMKKNGLVISSKYWSAEREEKAKSLSKIKHIFWRTDPIYYDMPILLLRSDTNEIQRYTYEKEGYEYVDSYYGDGVTYEDNHTLLIPVRDFIMAYDSKAVIDWDENLSAGTCVFRDYYHMQEIKIQIKFLHDKKQISVKQKGSATSYINGVIKENKLYMPYDTLCAVMNIGNYEYDDVLNRIIVDREERYPEILD